MARLPLLALIPAFLLAACEEAAAPPSSAPALAPVAADSVSGDVEAVYVPVYSRIFSRDSTRSIELVATLSLRNTDPAASVRIDAVRYYDSVGRLVRSYLARPLVLGPLGSHEVVVSEDDRTGGVGANFVVEWRADEATSAPLFEAVMISTAGTQGISFVSRGVPIGPRGGE